MLFNLTKMDKVIFFKKIKLKLSLSQIEALTNIFNVFILMYKQDNDIFSQATMYRTYKLFECKIRNNILIKPKKCKLSLNVSEAETLQFILNSVEYEDLGALEGATSLQILSEIGKHF